MYLYVTKIYILSSIFVANVPRRKAAQMLEGHVTNYSSGFFFFFFLLQVTQVVID